jgi:hypothetical protein
MSDKLFLGIITSAPSILWFILVVVLIVTFRDALKQALAALAWRVKSGASIKIASVELGETYILPSKGEPKSTKLIQVKADAGCVRYQERGNYYLPNRDLFLVHTVTLSQNPKQLYDIRIYLVPHKEATLTGIQRIEYYFGEHWHNRIFVSTNRPSGFMISTSAYGPFVCTAEVYFTDGKTSMLWRYIDFEMGCIGKG